ncbi:MAG: acetyl-CoA carboxylase carboxyltransferase subunit alpha [Candidatus Marinimicrobia bacterium]|nr:acetyl-CoA carboxylase carboxyltransferase subunit alpha [Candidatus Neomarinimicrobiota bacterium]MCH8069029.1 acetyl-CoA carboxylase carboxyltransferase subunit alpha [Candidatus Neomarinimicrobiota bacterium]
MAEFHLNFEKPIIELERKIDDLKSINAAGNTDLSQEIRKLEDKHKKLIEKTYSNLSRWQRVQLARHPRRPYSLDYITRISPDFFELHGDRNFADDKSIVTGIGSIDGMQVVWIGQQKGKNTKDNLYRNFGMSKPEGYRKALRVMELSEKYNRPIICLIDTPGAYPGIGAEERGQAEAIARNLLRMSSIKVPILIIIIGEGASGGALGIGVGDKLIMLENTWFSVISPEGCASILWRDASKAELAADAMKVTAQDLYEMGICDRIIKEPLGGAHRDNDKMVEILKKVIIEELNRLLTLNTSELLDHRLKKYEKIGVWEE